MLRLCWLSIPPLVALACGGDANELVVDLRTDLIPGEEFDGVVVSLDGAPAEDSVVRTGTDYVAGVRIAEISALTLGGHDLRVDLLDDGAVVVSRPIRVEVRGSTGVTIVVTRDCRGVTCPADDPTATSCLGGRCASPECTPETPALCPAPECAAAADCTDGAACAVASCGDGVCLYGDDGMCAADEYCRPEVGCLPRTASSMDASMDSSGDASMDSSGDADATSPDGGVPALRWAIAFTPTTGTVAVDDVFQHATGVVVVGQINGTTDFDGTTRSGTGASYVARVASSGAVDWVSILDGDMRLWLECGAADSAGRIWVAGSYRGNGVAGVGPANEIDFFVAELDPADGTVSRTLGFGGNGEDHAHEMVYADSPGGPRLIIVGHHGARVSFDGPSVSNAGGSDGFLGIFNANNLTFIDGTNIGTVDADEINAVSYRPEDDTLTVTGIRNGVIGRSGWVEPGATGELFVQRRALATLAVEWDESVPGAVGSGIFLGPPGTFVTGYTEASDFLGSPVTPTGRDGFVAEWTLADSLRRVVTFGDGPDDRGREVAWLDGALLMAGQFRGVVTTTRAGVVASSGGTDALLMSITESSGTAIFNAFAEGGPLDDVAYAIIVMNSAAYVAGEIGGQVSFRGAVTLGAPGVSSVYLASYD